MGFMVKPKDSRITVTSKNPKMKKTSGVTLRQKPDNREAPKPIGLFGRKKKKKSS